jgi:hypothetical protein
MKKISIKKGGVVTNGPVLFETEEAAESWVSECEAKLKFGPLFTYAIIREDVAPDYRELRRAEYQRFIDPVFQEAVLENMVGRPEKLDLILAKREEIRAKYPKS